MNRVVGMQMGADTNVLLIFWMHPGPATIDIEMTNSLLVTVHKCLSGSMLASIMNFLEGSYTGVFIKSSLGLS